MGLFNNDFKVFSKWLDDILTGNLPSGIKAFNFNIYEGENETYDIQIIGSDEFDENDEDWACSTYYISEEICFIKRTKKIEN